jgi:hypothetical protein
MLRLHATLQTRSSCARQRDDLVALGQCRVLRQLHLGRKQTDAVLQALATGEVWLSALTSLYLDRCWARAGLLLTAAVEAALAALHEVHLFWSQAGLAPLLGLDGRHVASNWRTATIVQCTTRKTKRWQMRAAVSDASVAAGALSMLEECFVIFDVVA